MTQENIITALDIGTTKILAVVAEMDEQGGIFVIGHGIAPAEGLRRGIVVDMEKTVRSVRKAVDDAQMVSGVDIDSVTVGIAGEHIRSLNSHGVVAVGRSDYEITASDVDKATEAARTISIPIDREIIHVIPQVFSVDDQTGIKDPVGMTGVRLEVEAHIVTASVTSAKNIFRALERCNLAVDHMVLEALAMANVYLTDEEIDIGAAIVDIGGDITNIAVFDDGAIRHTAVIPLGARNVTNDIAIGLRTSVEQAEQLKTTYGASLTSLVDPEEMITIGGLAGRPDREISRNVLASIVEPRMEEIFTLVGRELRKVMQSDVLTAGMVLTGGGSMMPGSLELAEQMFDIPVRVGVMRQIEHIPDELNDVRYSVGHGLLVYGFNHEPLKKSRNGGVRKILRNIENWITKQF